MLLSQGKLLLWDSVQKKDTTGSHEQWEKGIAVSVAPGQGQESEGRWATGTG